MTAAIYTLGCKLNQTESGTIAAAFRDQGLEILPPPRVADIFVVNTCTVTSMAEQKARGVIRNAAKRYACVLVCGCYARLEREQIEALGDNVFVFDGIKSNLAAVLAEIVEKIPSLGEKTAVSGKIIRQPFLFDDENAEDIPSGRHSRAFLKIQDGCDRHCSYCRVCLARGKSVSVRAEEVLAGLRAFEDAGYAEAVLTGVNLNQYTDGHSGLGGLLEFLLAGTQMIRLRLSSLEPEAVTPELVQTLSHKRIRPHFHLSVQSGSNGVLRRMRRPYTAELVEESAALLRQIKDDPFLACDIIAGFPGETPADFQDTYSLCRRIGFGWIHAFPFSPRPGTDAFDFPDKVNEGEVTRRVERLLNTALEGKRAYIKRQLGNDRDFEAVVERRHGYLPKGCVAAVAENYMKLLIKIPDGEIVNPGSLLRVRLTGFGDRGFDAEGLMIGRP